MSREIIQLGRPDDDWLSIKPKAASNPLDEDDDLPPSDSELTDDEFDDPPPDFDEPDDEIYIPPPSEPKPPKAQPAASSSHSEPSNIRVPDHIRAQIRERLAQNEPMAVKQSKKVSQEPLVPGETEKDRVAKIAKKDLERHSELMMQLNKYMIHPSFGATIREYGLSTNNLQSKSLAQLEELMARIEFVISNRNGGGGLYKSGALLFCGKVEESALLANLIDLEGYTVQLAMNKEWSDAMDQIEIQKGLNTSSPERRIIKSMLMTAWAVNRANTARRTLLAEGGGADDDEEEGVKPVAKGIDVPKNMTILRSPIPASDERDL